MPYNEKELLMLSNFVYLDAAKEEGSIQDILDKYKNTDGSFTPESVKGAGTGGGLDNTQVSELFESMQKECDKSGSNFGDLTPSRRLEENDIRGICYTNAKDENPVVVFRGTGGTKKAWQDNMYGGFKTDTRLQKVANDFVKYECAAYDNITVTGHSKGGNLSQYVTVMNNSKISSCVSFDGQGMNDDFIKANYDAVVASSPKIKSISAYNDFVNILLTGIAGTVMYVKNTGSGVDAHSSFLLLKSNEFDENGNFTSERKQSAIAEAMKRTTDRIVKTLGLGTEEDNIIIGGILGEAIATMVMSRDSSEMLGAAKQAASEAMLAFTVKLDALFGDEDMEIAGLPSAGVLFDHDSVKQIALDFDDARAINNSFAEKTENVMGNMNISIASRFYADMALLNATSNIRKNTENMLKMIDIMNISCQKYANQESMTTLRMGCYESSEISGP